MSAEARRRSSSLFNNDKFVEVVVALQSEMPRPVTTQEIAHALGVNHDLVRKVLVRLVDAGLVKTLPRVGGSRGALPYEVQQTAEWAALASLCSLLVT